MTEHDLDVQRRRRAAKLPQFGPIENIEEKEVTEDGRADETAQKDGDAGEAD
jgi:hypothetical protein